MKKIYFILLIALFKSLSVSAQPPVNWTFVGDTVSFSEVFSKMLTDDYGNIYVSTNHYSFGNYIVNLYKFDQFGHVIWVKADSTYPVYNSTSDLCFDDQGNIYSVGIISTNPAVMQSSLTKYDTSGTILAQTLYIGPNDLNTYTNSITYFDSAIYISGYADVLPNKERALIQKYDLACNNVWTIYDSIYNPDGCSATFITHDSQNLIVTGYASKNSIMEKMFLAKYDTSGGTVWKFIDTFPYDYNLVTAIAVDRSDNIYVTLNGSFYLLVKFDSAGNMIWGFQGTGNFTEGFSHMKLDSIGNIYCSGTGTVPDSASGTALFLVTKFNSSGSAIFNYPNYTSIQSGPFDFLSQNDIVVLGLSSLGNVMIDLDSSGIIHWVYPYSYEYPGVDAEDIVVDDMKNILVGSTFMSPRYHFELMKFGFNPFIGIDDPVKQSGSFWIFPNPISSGSELNLIFNAKKNDRNVLRIYSIDGKIVFEKVLENSMMQSFGIPLLSDGIYQCMIENSDGRIFQKLVVTK